MSFRAQRWAYSLRDLSGPEKAVLNCLAWHHSGKTGLCCPGNALIAEETGFGLSTVKKALASLIRRGLVSRYPWKGKTAYLLAITEPAKAPTEPPPIKEEVTGRERKGSDWDGRKSQPGMSGIDRECHNSRFNPINPINPAPMSDGRARAEKRIAETRAITAPVTESLTPEERAAIVERALGRYGGARGGA